jgi:hypothetical protein
MVLAADSNKNAGAFHNVPVEYTTPSDDAFAVLENPI